MDFILKKNYNISDLLRIMQVLRSEEGCPWDKEQNHETIKKNFIEETYEVIEAINLKDDSLLCEELGDVLLQIVFHAQMANEREAFAFSEVCDGICKKLVERHPHVFGELQVKDSNEVLSNWDKIKTKSKHRDSVTDEMNAVPKELPALMRSEKVQKKAAKVGFDWPTVEGALDKIFEEAEELKKAFELQDKSLIAEELGDLLFSTVNVSRFAQLDAEETLGFACNKFIKRFSEVEKLALERKIDMKHSDLETLDKLWDEVKTLYRD